MNGTPFHQTAMGRAFYERDVPALVRELARLNDLIERLIATNTVPQSSPAKCQPREVEKR